MSDALAAAADLVPQLAARAEEHDAAGAFPTADVAALSEAGLLGLMVPERLGGFGAGFADYTRVAQTLARGAGATALVFNMHASVTGALASVPEDLARQLGAGEAFFAQRDRLLAAAAQGALYGVGITERGAGSRLHALRTTYEPEGEGYRLRGHKSTCSGAGHLDGYLVAAKAAHAVDDPDGPVSHFLVPGEAISDVEDTWDVQGMRATASNGFSLDCHVGADTLLGGIEGVAGLLAYGLPQWLVASYAAVYAGVARAAVDAGVSHVADRTVAGQAGGLGQVGWVRARLGRTDAQAEAARLVLEEAGRLVDLAPGEPTTNAMIYRAKLLAGDAARDAADSVAEACGLAALRRGHPLERLVRDARSGPVMPPSSDLAADVLATQHLGLDPVHGTDVRPW